MVGKKPAWVLFAESAKASEGRCDQLLAMGAFTSADLAKVNGWTNDRAKNYLSRYKPPLKCEIATDTRTAKNAPTRFYFPPTP